jgi:hypothetical protein
VAAATVRGRVRALAIALAPLRLLECALAAASAHAVVLAAAVASGARAEDPAAHAAAALGALAVAALAARERLLAAPGVARLLDRGLALDGALLTAWEVEPRAGSSPLAAALVERARGALRGARGARALAARTPPVVLALPLGAAALLVLALERAADEPLPRAAALAARASGLAADAAGRGDPAARDLERASASLEAAAARGQALPPSTLREAVGGVLAALERSAAEGPAHEGARREARELLAELDGPAAPRDGEARGERDASAGAARGPSGSGAGPAAGGGDGRDGVHGGQGGGTMGGRTPRDEAAASAPPGAAGAGAGERGVVAGRWWPERYDPVVARWLERRGAPADPPRHVEDP